MLDDDDKRWIVEQIARVQADVERLDTKLERVETSLLTEFHKWASPVDGRQRSHAPTVRALNIEFEALAP